MATRYYQGMDERRVIRRLFAKVLARMTDDSVDVFLSWSPDVQGAPITIPLALVPSDLRRPNAQFILVMDLYGRPTSIERFDPIDVPENLDPEWFYSSTSDNP